MNKNEALQILNLSNTHTNDDLKTAYRKAAMQTHPDRENGTPEAFARVVGAYNLLSQQVCTTCGGTGRMTVYDGPLKHELKCPQCWNKEN